MLNWSYIEAEERKSLFIIDAEGCTKSVTDVHPNFWAIKALLEAQDRNESAVYRLLDPTTTLFSGEEVTHEDGVYYVNGTAVSVSLIETLLELKEIFSN
jgi:hypothetical protein